MEVYKNFSAIIKEDNFCSNPCIQKSKSKQKRCKQVMKLKEILDNQSINMYLQDNNNQKSRNSLNYSKNVSRKTHKL